MTHGKGREFKKLAPLDPENAKDGHFQLLLFESERAWSYSRQLLSTNLSLRHHATGRFRRALHHSTQLLSLCQSLYPSRLSPSALLETIIYTLLLHGRFFLFRDQFDDALVQLSVARSLLDVLAEGAQTSREKAVFEMFKDEVGPEIRYCAYEMGRDKAWDVEGVVKDVMGQDEKGSVVVEDWESVVEEFKKQVGKGVEGGKEMLEPLMWEGDPVPVRNPELVDVLLKVQQAEKKLALSASASVPAPKGSTSKKAVAAYDAILAALSDAEQVARKLSEAQSMQININPNMDASAMTPGVTRDVHFVHAYIVYQLLSRRIQRDLGLVEALVGQAGAQARPGSASKGGAVDTRLFPAIVKLLDTILQSLNQMRTLSIVDDSPDLASAVDARVGFAKGERCLALSRCYTPLKKYAEALTLIQHGQIHTRETTTFLSLSGSELDVISVPLENSGTIPFYKLDLEDVKKLEGEIGTEGMKVKREWFGFNGGVVKPEGEGKPHKKPLFFNIALNYVELDMERLEKRAGKAPVVEAKTTTTSVAEKMKKATAIEEEEEKEEEKTPATRGGLSSLLGGWWGRS